MNVCVCVFPGKPAKLFVVAENNNDNDDNNHNDDNDDKNDNSCDNTNDDDKMTMLTTHGIRDIWKV